MIDFKIARIIDFLNTSIPRLIERADKLVFTDTKTTPAMLDEALRKMGYSFEDQEVNGWENDCWIKYGDHDILPPVTLFYSGFYFEIELYLTEDTEEE